MKFHCKKCHTTWDSDDSVSQGLVQCPNCFTVWPLAVAQLPGGKSSTQTRTSSQTIHELPTVIESPGLATTPTTTDEVQTVQKTARTMPLGATDKTVIDPSLAGASRVSTPRPDTREKAPPRAASTTATVIEDEISRTPSPRQAAPSPTRPKSTPSAARKESAATRPALHGADLSGLELGGYEIKATLGKGGMGTVYMARQKSLDRYVALKVLPAEMAANPEFLARFTREALAAAQLTHHNVVQVYDVGSEDNTHFISMEYVRGTNLGEMVRRDGRLQVDDAVGYVLQAARALKYAHDHGIIHRDIKPDNLLLNDLGVVKVADLGLAKFHHAHEGGENAQVALEPEGALNIAIAGDITLKAVAMGTPAYMPPEQARDAAHVDARADQYALGCTLYYLITGKPPFSGTTAFEIITKHLKEPVPPLETHVRGVPTTLKAIIERMLAKDPDDRYPSMQEVIQDLEAYLGVDSEKGAYRPREIHLSLLESAQQRYYGTPLRKVQRLGPRIFLGVAALLGLACLALGAPRTGAFFLLTGAMTPIATVLLDGLLHRSYFVRRLRSALFGMPLSGWGKVMIVLVLAALAVYQIGLLALVLSAMVTSLVLAGAYEFGVLRRLRKERMPALAELEQMLKELRVRGMPEDALQEFVARFAGQDWEELFEDLFGYEALVLARGKVAAAERVKKRRVYAPWRDPIMRWLDEIERRRREAKELKQLAKVEAKRLEAQGVAAEEALRQAHEAATVILTEIKAATGAPKQTVYVDPFAKRKSWRWLRAGLVGAPYRVARAVAGLALLLPFLAAWLGPRLPGSTFVSAAMGKLPIPKETMNVLLSYYGIACGIVLLISAASRRLVGPSLMVVGVMIVLLPGPFQPVLALIPMAIPALWAGAGLIGLGFFLCAWKSMRGEKF